MRLHDTTATRTLAHGKVPVPLLAVAMHFPATFSRTCTAPLNCRIIPRRATNNPMPASEVRTKHSTDFTELTLRSSRGECGVGAHPVTRASSRHRFLQRVIKKRWTIYTRVSEAFERRQLGTSLPSPFAHQRSLSAAPRRRTDF